MKKFVLFVIFVCLLVGCSPLCRAAEVGGSGQANGWTLGSGGVIVDTILDEDAMGSDDPNALATQQSIKAYVDSQGGGSARWTAETTFSRTDDNTINITVSDCSNYGVGTPIRFSADESTWYYAVIVSCTDAGATINIDIDGIPFTTARDDYLSHGVPEALRTIQLTGVGNAFVSDEWFPKYLWGGEDAYLVRFYIKVDTAPTGAALQGNIEIDGTNCLESEWSVAAAGTSTDSGTTIDDTTYDNCLIKQDEFLEIDVSQIGSTIPGGNAAWTKLYLVIP